MQLPVVECDAQMAELHCELRSLERQSGCVCDQGPGRSYFMFAVAEGGAALVAAFEFWNLGIKCLDWDFLSG